MIHGTFAVATVLNSDKIARAAEQLTAALSGFNKAAAHFCASLVELMTAEAGRAMPKVTCEKTSIPRWSANRSSARCSERDCWATAIAAKGLVEDDAGEDLIGRTGRMWELLLGGIASEASLPYFRQFLAREALRHAQPAVVVPGVRHCIAYRVPESEVSRS